MMKWMKRWAPLLLALMLFGCGNAESNSAKPPAKVGHEEKPVAQEEPVQQPKTNYTVKDDRDIEITFDTVPEKVISLMPSNTEILFSLGAGEKIVGATEFDHYPEEAAKIERVSDTGTYNAERILALAPDVVFAYTVGAKDSLQPLEDAGIKVFVIKTAATFEDVYGDIQQIAEVMGTEEKGEEVIKNIKDQIAKVQEKTKSIENKPAVYFEISPRPEIYTVGSGTFQQEIFEAADVVNLFADQAGWIQISEEEIISRNPDVILTTVGYVDDPITEITTRTGWNDLTAVKNEAVTFLDEDVMSRPGPRIGEAVELLAKTVYPEQFK